MKFLFNYLCFQVWKIGTEYVIIGEFGIIMIFQYSDDCVFHMTINDHNYCYARKNIYDEIIKQCIENYHEI